MKAALKRVALGVLAAFTTPEAIKAEKSLATIVLTRLAILVPAAAFAIDLLIRAIN